jgi:hypothetical protein
MQTVDKTQNLDLASVLPEVVNESVTHNNTDISNIQLWMFWVKNIGYWVTVSSIFDLLNELKYIVLYNPRTSNLTCWIKLEMNLHG